MLVAEIQPLLFSSSLRQLSAPLIRLVLLRSGLLSRHPYACAQALGFALALCSPFGERPKSASLQRLSAARRKPTAAAAPAPGAASEGDGCGKLLGGAPSAPDTYAATKVTGHGQPPDTYAATAVSGHSQPSRGVPLGPHAHAAQRPHASASPSNLLSPGDPPRDPSHAEAGPYDAAVSPFAKAQASADAGRNATGRMKPVRAARSPFQSAVQCGADVGASRLTNGAAQSGRRPILAQPRAGPHARTGMIALTFHLRHIAHTPGTLQQRFKEWWQSRCGEILQCSQACRRASAI